MGWLSAIRCEAIHGGHGWLLEAPIGLLHKPSPLELVNPSLCNGFLMTILTYVSTMEIFLLEAKLRDP